MVFDLTLHHGQGPVKLTERETQVVFWIVQGKNNAYMAGLLGVTPKRIENIRQALHTKLDVHNYQELTMCILINKLIPIHSSFKRRDIVLFPIEQLK